MGSTRSKGTLKKWFAEKGFGFISPDKGPKDVFIHVSAFDRNIPRRPKVGDTIFYHVHTDKNGKTKAVDAVIEGVESVVRKNKPKPKQYYK
ncbi:MAG: cold shock domain-containing protein [Bacteroidetes bacterium]|nr:cold shock domain-containing protein [Bacteroidota bacterium]